MRVAIIGLGGVGGYLAASFAEVGIDVVGFGRGEHLVAIQKNGLLLKEDKKELRYSIDARVLSEADGLFDVLFFCVKSYDLRESYRSIEKYIDKNSILLSFSNGVDNGDILRELSQSRVLDGAVYILSHIENFGVIRKKGELFAAVFGGESSAVQQVAALFEKAKLRYKISNDIKKALWKKYIFIAAFAPLTSYYDKPIAAIYHEHYNEAKEVLQEIAMVAKSEGIDIDSEIEKSLDTAKRVPKDASTSMHLDFKNNKKTEIESLTAFLVKKEEVATPLLTKLYRELMERS